ncbi:hypothetical protein GCM10011414_18890 [Croceivirga lutea]|nr:hypothetical protein GCM10011414_18890 [Croceivirga lutea]
MKKAAFCSLDLSVSNTELNGVKISNPEECQIYIDGVLKRNGAQVAFGGYLEERKLYEESSHFSQGATRNIHLGMDFWCDAGTPIYTPIAGKVHSFKNNFTVGDYGPTIILEHTLEGYNFYTLYGHLSLASLDGLTEGKEFKKGQKLATLGETAINVNYAPHLHFQLIKDVNNNYGDYPGVCAKVDVAYYANNCPDPNLLFQF